MHCLLVFATNTGDPYRFSLSLVARPPMVLPQDCPYLFDLLAAKGRYLSRLSSQNDYHLGTSKFKGTELELTIISSGHHHLVGQ